MINDYSKEFLEFSEQWEALFNAGKFDDAIGVGIKSYLTFRKAGEKKWSDGSLNLIAVTIPSVLGGQDILDGDRPIACSFCAQSGSKDTLIAGPDVFICGDCAKLADKILNKKMSSKEKEK